MGALSESYIMGLLRKYIKSDEGKAKIQEYHLSVFNGRIPDDGSPFSREKINEYLEAIRLQVWKAIVAVIPSFARSYGNIHAELTGADQRGIRASISIDEEALHRASLHYMNRKTFRATGALTVSAGKGVDDILALFAHGYSIHGHRPFGFWVHDGGNSEEYIGARMRRDPNPFLETVVDEVNDRYHGIGSAILDKKYTH